MGHLTGVHGTVPALEATRGSAHNTVRAAFYCTLQLVEPLELASDSVFCQTNLATIAPIRACSVFERCFADSFAVFRAVNSARCRDGGRNCGPRVWICHTECHAYT